MAGGVACASTGTGPVKREPLSRPQKRVLLGLYIGYSSMIFSKAALDVAIPLMLEDSQMEMYPGDVGRLLTICSACYLVGKLSTGYSVDRLGAKFVFLWLASFTSAVLTGLVSTCQDTHRLTLTVCAMFVAQSSGWSALTSLVSAWLHPSQYGMAFGFLSTSSRMGDVASKMVLGRLASLGWDWRALFVTASALQMACAACNQVLLPRSPPTPSTHTAAGGAIAAPLTSGGGAGCNNGNGNGNGNGCGSGGHETGGHGASVTRVEEAEEGGDGGGHKTRRPIPLEHATPAQALLQSVLTPRFATVTLGVACMHVVMEFDKYLPLYIHRALHRDAGQAAEASALYPFSQLLALAIAGVGYDRLSPVGKLVTVSGLSFLVFFFFSLQWLFKLYALPVADVVYLVLIFLSGFSLAVPYYLPPSIFIVDLGGKKHCGMLSGILDACGGLAAMLFHCTVGSLASSDRWIELLGILAAVSFLGFLALTAFQRHSLLSSASFALSKPPAKPPAGLVSSLLRPLSSSTLNSTGPSSSATGAGDLRARKARSSFELDEASAMALFKPSTATSSSVQSGGGRMGHTPGSVVVKRGQTTQPTPHTPAPDSMC